MSQEVQVASRNWHRQRNLFSPRASGRKQPCCHLDFSPITVPGGEHTAVPADLTGLLTSSRPSVTLPPLPLRLYVSYQFALLNDYVTASLLSSICQLPPLTFPMHSLWWCCLLEGLNYTTQSRATKTLANPPIRVPASAPHSLSPCCFPYTVRPPKANPPLSPTQEHHCCSSPSSLLFLSPLDPSHQHMNGL